MKSRAVFLDRDDTLIKNIPYLGDPALVQLLPYAAESLAQLQKAGYELFLISNQSGVGRGLITPEQVAAVTAEMNRQLGRNFFCKIYHCFEKPNHLGASPRKPSPHCVYAAAREFSLDLAGSYFVGDRLSDILAGRNAGCRTILVLSGHEMAERPRSCLLADQIAADMREAAAQILAGTI